MSPGSILHQRIQHAVGQGFFHTAMVESVDGTFRYVYDCGATPKYRKSLDAAIRAYRTSIEVTRRLDVLFISHAHADHVNGIARLLKGLDVDTIMLPLLTVEERLIAFARSASESPALVNDAFYRHFIADPAAALAQFAPRQILFVGRDTLGGGAPGSTGEIGPYDESGGDRIGGQPHAEGGPRWKLVGRGAALHQSTVTSKGKTEPVNVATVLDTRGIAIDVCMNSNFWLLAPYVDKGLTTGKRLFLREISERLKLSIAKLSHVPALKELLGDKDKITIIAKCYEKIAHDLNATSLCLYSGPSSIQHRDNIQLSYFTDENIYWKGVYDRIGWLGTGDATLRQRKHRENFVNHFRVLLSNVRTMTLPHHGSDKNSDEKLLESVNPYLCVASADRYSNWHHPGSTIVQILASRHIPMALVTGTATTELRECAVLSLRNQ
jgi:hypothetical protein